MKTAGKGNIIYAKATPKHKAEQNESKRGYWGFEPIKSAIKQWIIYALASALYVFHDLFHK